MTFRSCWLSGLGLGVRPGIAQSTVNICAGFLTAMPYNSRLTAQAPLRRLRHLELCGITLCKRPAYFPACKT